MQKNNEHQDLCVPRKYQLKFTFSPSTIKTTHFNVGKVKKSFHEHKVFFTIGGHSSHEHFTRL